MSRFSPNSATPITADVTGVAIVIVDSATDSRPARRAMFWMTTPISANASVAHTGPPNSRPRVSPSARSSDAILRVAPSMPKTNPAAKPSSGARSAGWAWATANVMATTSTPTSIVERPAIGGSDVGVLARAEGQQQGDDPDDDERGAEPVAPIDAACG